MKQNIRIAKQLVRIAKDIVAGGKRIREEGVWSKDVQGVVKGLCDDPGVKQVMLSLVMSGDPGDGHMDGIKDTVDVKGGYGDYQGEDIMDYIMKGYDYFYGIEDVRIDEIRYRRAGEGGALHVIPVQE